MVRVATAVALPLLLSGCFIPPAVTFAKLAVDGVSMAATGRSTNDHVLSAAVGEDCAMWRVLKGEAVCVEYGPGEPRTTLVAQTQYDPMDAPQSMRFSGTMEDPLLESVGPLPADASPARDSPVLQAEVKDTEFADLDLALAPGQAVVVRAAAAPATRRHAAVRAFLPIRAAVIEAVSFKPLPPAEAPEAPPLVGEASWSAPPADGGALYLVLGSFADAPSAERHAAALASVFSARVVGATAAGRDVFRVVAGPFRDDAARARRDVARAGGVADAWLVRL